MQDCQQHLVTGHLGITVELQCVNRTLRTALQPDAQCVHKWPQNKMIVHESLVSYRLVLAGTKKQQPYAACSGVTLAGTKLAARGRPL